MIHNFSRGVADEGRFVLGDGALYIWNQLQQDYNQVSLYSVIYHHCRFFYHDESTDHWPKPHEILRPSGSLSSKPWDILPPNLAKSQHHEIWASSTPIAQKLERRWCMSIFFYRYEHVNTQHGSFRTFERYYSGADKCKNLSNYNTSNRFVTNTL